ncbi:hypothetical protein CIP106467_3939 [Citrobacter europaeus]|nr:hypothetical protein CIP106467_3939 [Citrobacter europaeus]
MIKVKPSSKGKVKGVLKKDEKAGKGEKRERQVRTFPVCY